MALKDFMVKSNVQMMGHQTVGGYLAGPTNFIIDPATVGDDTGTVEIKGSLQVNGTTTTVNSTTLDVADINITVAKGAANAGAADGAGLTVDGANATLTYASTGDKWVFNKAPFYNTDALLVASDLSVATDATPAGDGGISYDASTKQFTYTPAVLSGLTGSTDDITEGTTNLYYTDARADIRATLRVTAADIGNLNNVDETGVANNKILKYNSTTSKWEVADDAGGIADVVDDTSPQLGGNLESNGFNIEMADNNKIALGTGERGKLEHTGASGKLLLFSTTGGIDIRTYANDEVIAISSDDGSGGIANYVIADGSTGATELYHYGSKKIATTSTGVEVTGSTTSETLISTIATGTAPLTVASTTMVSNLNADKLDDKEFTDIIAEATALAIALG